MVTNILPTDTPLTQGVGSKGQTIYFSESSHVAYQIKADDAGSNMAGNIHTLVNFVCGGYTVFTLSVRPCVRASVRKALFP